MLTYETRPEPTIEFEIDETYKTIELVKEKYLQLNISKKKGCPKLIKNHFGDNVFSHKQDLGLHQLNEDFFSLSFMKFESSSTR